MRGVPPETARLTEGYEALRALALGQDMPLASPRGLALFLRRGMAGWMGAWSSVVAPAPVEVSRPWAGKPMEANWTRQAELATVLAGMALAAAGR